MLFVVHFDCQLALVVCWHYMALFVVGAMALVGCIFSGRGFVGKRRRRLLACDGGWMAMMIIWTAAPDRMCVGAHKEEESFNKTSLYVLCVGTI